jgi:hypothetical protein
MVTQTGPAVQVDQPGQGMTWRWHSARGAGALPGAGNVVNVLSDPYANLVARPLLTAERRPMISLRQCSAMIVCQTGPETLLCRLSARSRD